MSEQQVTVNRGPIFSTAGALTILFVLLKVFGKIDWSWWWVFSPIWISFGLFLLTCVGLLVFAAIIGAISIWLDDR